jgi:hypothetical protein
LFALHRDKNRGARLCALCDQLDVADLLRESFLARKREKPGKSTRLAIHVAAPGLWADSIPAKSTRRETRGVYIAAGSLRLAATSIR